MRVAPLSSRIFAVLFAALMTASNVLQCHSYILLRLKAGPEVTHYNIPAQPAVNVQRLYPAASPTGFARGRRSQVITEERLRRSEISHMLKQPILGMSQWWNDDHDQEVSNYYY
uniref:Transmembrane protein n=1 Tax=Panagrellus redivivus TaxID=6233 RepID=A0A7E4VFP3_PANRE